MHDQNDVFPTLDAIFGAPDSVMVLLGDVVPRTGNHCGVLVTAVALQHEQVLADALRLHERTGNKIEFRENIHTIRTCI